MQVIIDYLRGRPTEALLSAITRGEFAAVTSETRLVQVGEGAGPAISLRAVVQDYLVLRLIFKDRGLEDKSGRLDHRARGRPDWCDP